MRSPKPFLWVGGCLLVSIPDLDCHLYCLNHNDLLDIKIKDGKEAPIAIMRILQAHPLVSPMSDVSMSGLNV